MILAIDTSVGVSVALHSGDEVISEINSSTHGQQGELTSQYISQAMHEAGLTADRITKVLVGVGPGPFTGLRVGIVSALVFAHARSIEVSGLCSLDAVGLMQSGECIVVTDARRKELYWAKYQDGRRVTSPAVNSPADIKDQAGALPIVGPGALLYPEILSATLIELRAANLAQAFISGLAELHPVVPMYLRKPDAVEPTNIKAVAQ